MSGFSAGWLELREPYDARARNRDVLAAVAAAFADQSAVSIVDLGCGTGATLRAVAPHLPARQSWRLVDNDLGLLARAASSDRPAHASVTPTPVDLARDLEAALDGAVDLVTTKIQKDVLAGWASAAREFGELPLGDIVAWLTRRSDLIAAGRSTMRIGHMDLFARPIGLR